MIVVAALGALFALAGLLTAVHFLVMALASLFWREPDPGPDVPPVSFLVLIPAHNEELLLARTLQSVRAVMRPRDTLLVVADNCTDRTAEIAREFTDHVLERTTDPGRAQARQAGLEAARELAWDAVVMVDADSELAPGFLDACERRLAPDVPALQARSEGALGKRLVDQATLAAFALQGVTLPRGRDRLGLLVRLRGTGMVLRREIVERHRFRAPASEDLWFSLDLCLDGILPRHTEAARLRSSNAPNWRAAAGQRERYEAGRMSAARAFLGPLLRRRSRAAFEAAWYLASPPFSAGVLALALALVAGVVASAPFLVGVALGGIVALAFALVVALLQARTGPRTWLALLIAPFYVVWKSAVHLRALAGLRDSARVYGATER